MLPRMTTKYVISLYAMTDSSPQIDRSRLESLIASARVRASTRNRPVLVTFSERLPKIDPLPALENLTRTSISNRQIAGHITAGRVYWACPRDGFALAGIGAVATFAPEGADRFQSVDAAWSALLASAVIDDPSVGASGVGPILMGGFAFDPHTRQSGRWNGFSSAHMIVPRLLLTSTGGKCWATFSLLVGADGNPDANPELLSELLSAALEPSKPAPNAGPEIDASPGDLSFSESQSAAQWRAIVGTAVEDIRAGAFQKVVLARDVHATAPHDLDVFAMLRHLRATHRNSFVFGYWRGESAFVGATPERLVRLDGREVRASSLAGTEKRGSTPDEDAALSALLLASAKDRAEHAAVRDSLYSSLSEICDEVIAADAPSLLTLPHVHHLHTPVQARLREGHSLLDVVARLHPTPAVGGTPREAALRFIRDHEQLDRGWYAAPIGWIGRESGEFAVALRSALIAGSEASLFAGCGIVADSDPELEFKESVLKLRPMQSALAAAVADTRPDFAEIGATLDVSR